MGACLSVTNKTEFQLHMSLNQVTPLYFENFVKPGETFKRNVGKVWFTIEARIASNENTYSTEKIVLPITLLTLTSIILNPVVAGIAAGVGAVATHSDGGSIVCSPGWYVGNDRHFEIRQRLVDDVHEGQMSGGAYVYRFRRGQILEFYLVEIK